MIKGRGIISNLQKGVLSVFFQIFHVEEDKV